MLLKGSALSISLLGPQPSGEVENNDEDDDDDDDDYDDYDDDDSDGDDSDAL